METNNIKLINADCMDIMKEYPDNYFDLAIVDPPYGIERFKKCKQNDDPNTKDVFANKFLKGESFNNTKPKKEYWDELFRVSKNQIVWGANNFTMPESEYFLIWDKKQAMPNFARCEYAWVSMGLKKPAKIYEFSIHKHNQTNKIHQTQKPINLYSFILENYAKIKCNHKHTEDYRSLCTDCRNSNVKILDTHLGSGSSAIAAHYFGVGQFVGIELDKDYYDAACKRFKEQTAQIDLFQ